jgi:putative two-component system response regulator
LSSYVYVILLTCLTGRNNLIQALDAGADDFIPKPFNPEELCVRLHTAQRIVALESRDLVIFAMARLAESRDPETGAHLERIREYARILAHELSRQPRFRDYLDGDYLRSIYLTSPLHDIGKVGIPDHVLLKPGRLNPEEFEIMKQHTEIGARTLEAALQAYPSAEFLRLARDIAWSHHERFDGTGYPRQLSGDDIPLGARIVAVADVYDALTTRRVYKPAYSHQEARSIIVAERGAAFDPDIVDAFLSREYDFLEVSRRLGPESSNGGLGGADRDEELQLTAPLSLSE